MESTHLDGDLKTINLKVLYKGQPARNYDYTYFDGRDWSNIFSAKDGTGIVELPVLANARNLQLRTEYMFEGEANIDNELSEVMGTVNPIAMRNCALKLEGEEPKPGEEKTEEALMAESDSATTTNSGMHYLSTMESAAYDDTMKKVEKLFVRAISPISNPYVPKADMKCSTASSNTDKARSSTNRNSDS